MKRIKPKVSSKDISEIKAETKVIENRKKIRKEKKIKGTESWFFVKISKIDKLLKD